MININLLFFPPLSSSFPPLPFRLFLLIPLCAVPMEQFRITPRTFLPPAGNVFLLQLTLDRGCRCFQWIWGEVQGFYEFLFPGCFAGWGFFICDDVLMKLPGPIFLLSRQRRTPVIPAKKKLPRGSGGCPKVSPLPLVEHPSHPSTSSRIQAGMGPAAVGIP